MKSNTGMSLLIHPTDNVIVALKNLAKGSIIHQGEMIIE